MSKLKNQLKVILPRLSEEANKNRDPEVKFRLYALKSIVESKKDVKKACEAKGVSTDFFYEWGGRLLQRRKLSSLKSKSRRPKTSPNKTSKRIERKILQMRKAEPSHGPERISFYLPKLFKVQCPPSTVFNVLKRFGLVDKGERKKRSKKHLKRYRRPIPGYLQMDIKYVPYRINGEQYYEFNAVDHCSSWRLIRAYEDKSYFSLLKFLSELDKECPFPVIQIQTDNGKEFTDKYRVNSDGFPTRNHPLDRWCEQREIEHKLIPIGVKELNGKVENTHGFDDREFYSQHVFLNYSSLKRCVRGWNERWNSLRATKSLGWRTPDEVVSAAYVAQVAFLLRLQDRYDPLVKITRHGFLEIKATPPPRTRKKKRAQKKSMLNRYLHWLEEDEKMGFKSIIAVPVMSQSLSRGPSPFLLGVGYVPMPH